jgi:hypothetical protein
MSGGSGLGTRDWGLGKSPRPHATTPSWLSAQLFLVSFAPTFFPKSPVPSPESR